MKKLLSLSLALLAAAAMTVPTLAASHTVQRGDTMWKLAVQYQVGTSEIIDANPQVANPNLIYPGNVLTIPETDASVRAYEQEVVRLVNAERAKHGLAALTEDWELPASRATSRRICMITVTSRTTARPTARPSR